MVTSSSQNGEIRSGDSSANGDAGALLAGGNDSGKITLMRKRYAQDLTFWSTIYDLFRASQHLSIAEIQQKNNWRKHMFLILNIINFTLN